MSTMDLTDIIVALAIMQSDLRALDQYPQMYPPDGHRDRVVNLTMQLQHEIREWMKRPLDSPERRHQHRRTHERRQSVDATKPTEAV